MFLTTTQTKKKISDRNAFRRGLRKRRNSPKTSSYLHLENSSNVNSNDCLASNDKAMNNNTTLKTSISSDAKYDIEETLLNSTNLQNASSTINKDYHLDDPSSTSVDANNDHQFSIKCEIDVEENLAEASTTDRLIKLDYVRKRSNPNACKIVIISRLLPHKVLHSFRKQLLKIESLSFAIV